MATVAGSGRFSEVTFKRSGVTLEAFSPVWKVTVTALLQTLPVKTGV